MELMRGLAFIALLFAGSAVGAELRQAEVCGDGTTHQAGYCPAVLSSASCSATGATTGSCSATSDETDGTRYVCATSSVTALTGAEIEACSGGTAVAGATPAAETGSNSMSLSGLTTDAAHYGQIVNKSPEQWYSNRLVPSSFTPATAAGTNEARIDAILGSYSSPFSVNYPSDPATTTTIQVTANSGSSLRSAVATDGARVIVPAGTYSGGISTFGDDVDIVMDNAATVTGAVTVYQASRVRWTGGNIDGLDASNFDGDATDVLFDNVNISNINSGYLQGTLTRWAFINSTISSNSYAVASQQFNTDVDVIYANCDIEGGLTQNQATFRLMSVHRAVIVGNRFANHENFALRLHYNMENAYVAGNQFEPQYNGEPANVVMLSESGGGTNTYGPFYNITFDSNEIYYLSGASGFELEMWLDGTGASDFPGAPPRNGVMTNNTSYAPIAVNNDGWTILGSATTDTNNQRLRGTYSPPAFSGGADH